LEAIFGRLKNRAMHEQGSLCHTKQDKLNPTHVKNAFVSNQTNPMCTPGRPVDLFGSVIDGTLVALGKTEPSMVFFFTNFTFYTVELRGWTMDMKLKLIFISFSFLCVLVVFVSC
jgi:hypothetical protein